MMTRQIRVEEKILKNSSAVSLLFIVTILFVSLLHADTVHAASEPLSSINNPEYGREPDNLHLTVKFIRLEPWTQYYRENLDDSLFEPSIVEMAIMSNVDGGDGPKKFFIKKGIDLSGMSEGTVLQIVVNKNSCEKEKHLVILDIQGWLRENDDEAR